MTRVFLVLAACSGFLAVALGAFGAHALRERLDAYSLSTYETAVQYHFVHTLALLSVAIISRNTDSQSPWLITSGIAFTVGLPVFSGSLYLLSVTGQRWLGAITPLGGLAFLVGWGCLAYWAMVETART